MIENSTPKTPEYTLRAVSKYSKSLIGMSFRAKQDSKRGQLATLAKQDPLLNKKFWQWLESEYAPDTL